VATLIVTIDGPAASGKSTVARLLAEKLGASFLDTGAMYRAVTLAALKARADITDQDQLLSILTNSDFEFAVKEGKMIVSIDGVDVTEQIRDPKVTANARNIASAQKLREKLVHMQRQFAAREEKIITEGRDQGTVAFPNANIKFYLTADTLERARRRQAELQAKGSSENLEKIKMAIEERDKSDQARAAGPLNLTIEEVVEKLLYRVEQCPKKDQR